MSEVFSGGKGQICFFLCDGRSEGMNAWTMLGSVRAGELRMNIETLTLEFSYLRLDIYSDIGKNHSYQCRSPKCSKASIQGGAS